MTTNTQTAAEIAAKLSAGEREALTKFVEGSGAIYRGDFDKLYSKELVDTTGITPLGTDVYRHLEPSAPEGGEAVSEKPPMITAKQFVDEGYAEKVKRGECVVNDEMSPDGGSVLDITTRKSTGTYSIWYNDQTFDFPCEPDDEFTVTWLPATAPTAAPQAEPAAGTNSLEESLNEILRFADADVSGADDINDADSYIELLVGKMTNIREEVTSVRVQLTTLEAANRDLMAQVAAAGKLVEACKPIAMACERLIVPDVLGYTCEHYGIVDKSQGKFLGIKEIHVRDLRALKAAYESWQQTASDNRAPGGGGIES